MGNILYWLIVGLVAGVIAKAIMPGTSKEPSGWIMTIVLGIVGALIGGWIAAAMGIGAGNILMQIVIAAIGAIILIAGLRLVTGGRRAV
jgi:uncharacterized membrane protein YeaQ/YmgE (transglycosylase-associated protein family)